MEKERDEEILFALLPDDVVVIRAIGRGTFKNSLGIKQLSGQLIKEGHNPRFIIDLEKCQTMDSAFMGVLAGVGKNQMKMGLGKTTVVNLNPQTERLLKTLGLTYILDIRLSDSEKISSAAKEFKSTSLPTLSKFEQTIHMIEAHQALIDIDESNRVRFQNVMFYLKDSLEREKKKQEGLDTESGE